MRSCLAGLCLPPALLLLHPLADTNNRSIISARGLLFAYFGRSLFICLRTTPLYYTIHSVSYPIRFKGLAYAKVAINEASRSFFFFFFPASLCAIFSLLLQGMHPIRPARLGYAKDAINRLAFSLLVA